jgi:hypothetical protein
MWSTHITHATNRNYLCVFGECTFLIIFDSRILFKIPSLSKLFFIRKFLFYKIKMWRGVIFTLPRVWVKVRIRIKLRVKNVLWDNFYLSYKHAKLNIRVTVAILNYKTNAYITNKSVFSVGVYDAHTPYTLRLHRIPYTGKSEHSVSVILESGADELPVRDCNGLWRILVSVILWGLWTPSCVEEKTRI